MVEGLHWLQQPRCHCPVGEVPKTVPEECLVEARNESVGVNDIVFLATVQESIAALALRYETWQRLVQVTAWILKWPRLCGEPKKGKLSEEELKESEFTWLRNRQTVVFLPEIEELCNKEQVDQKSHIVKLDPQFDQTKKLLVVGGRLRFAQIPVHLELLNSMTTEDFLQAFRRMANRSGMMKVIHSDNQTTFHKAAKVLIDRLIDNFI